MSIPLPATVGMSAIFSRLCKLSLELLLCLVSETLVKLRWTSVKIVMRKGVVVSLFTNLCMVFIRMEFNSTALYAWSLKFLYNLLSLIQTNTNLMAGPCNSGSGNQIN